MEKNDIDEGRKLVEDFFQPGKWYVFDKGNAKEYLHFNNFSKANKDTSRHYLQGDGFITNSDGKLTIPKMTKGEVMLFVWAKHYLTTSRAIIEISDYRAREIYQKACEKAYDDIFKK